MIKPTILVVDDNLLTRELMAVILQREGFGVLEAQDGESALELMQSEKPDLILQDLILPDMTGIELNQRFRDMPSGKDIPILAISGFLNRMNDEKAVHTGFDGFLMKPISSATLTQTIKTYLTRSFSSDELPKGKRILIADDDAAQRKILSHHLKQLGCEVEIALNGQEALKLALAHPPDAIISDILMPQVDGFDLCLKIRENQALANTPVILVTANYLEKSDHALANRVGASAYVTRTSDFDTVIDALKNCLSTKNSHASLTSDQTYKSEHMARISCQLDRQIIANLNLAQQCALQQAELSLLNSITTALVNRKKMDRVLYDVLLICLDATGISRGILYLMDRHTGVLRFKHSAGYNEKQNHGLNDFFGEMDFLTELMDKQRVVAIPSQEIPQETTANLLKQTGVNAALVVPLVSVSKSLGVLFLGYNLNNLIDADIKFAQTLGTHFAQTVSMAETFELLMMAEKRYRALMENSNCAIILHDQNGIVIEANRRCEVLFGYGEGSLLGRDFKDFVKVDETIFKQNLDRILNEKKAFSGVYPIKVDNGIVKELMVSIVNIEIDNENLFLVVLDETKE